MGQDPREVGAERLEDDSNKSPEQLRAEIEDARVGLGEAVEALAAKTDVKSRARDKADEVRRNAAAKKDELVAKAKAASPVGGSADSAGGATVVGPDGSVTTSATTTGTPAQASSGPSAVDKLKATAQQNPVPTAALAAFVGGMAFGRLTSRR
jgi:hypothetical protein